MNALDIKYKTDYITLRDVGSVLKGTIVRRSKWVTNGLGRKQDNYHINNDEYSVVMHAKNTNEWIVRKVYVSRDKHTISPSN